MIELRDHALEFSFPEVHPRARCQISFQRTLRIPDDNRPTPCPPGWGAFPSTTLTTTTRGFRRVGSSMAGSLCPCTSRRRCGWISARDSAMSWTRKPHRNGVIPRRPDAPTDRARSLWP